MARAQSPRVLGLALLVAAAWCSSAFVGGFRSQPALRSSVALYAASPETADKVADIIVEQLGVDKEKVTREATLTELGADSLDIVETVMAMEEEFDVELPDEETTQLKDVGDVMDLIETKL